jgi:chloramphenicol-sensitive protein RarD
VLGRALKFGARRITYAPRGRMTAQERSPQTEITANQAAPAAAAGAGVLVEPSDAERRAGFIAAARAYVMWGFLPLYLKLIAFADVREVLGQRILWAAPSALVAVFVMSGWRTGWREISTALRPRMMGTLALSACFIFVNWGIYVWLVMSQRVIESALAYFLAPLVSVAIGVLLFREKITNAQIIALALALVGVVVQGFAVGAPPWMALALCGTWSVYAVIRKRAAVPAATGLLIESVALAPVAAFLLYLAASEAPLAFWDGWEQGLLLAIAGPVTALPLMLFAFGARRVSFVTLGLLQFLAPTLQFMTGIAFGEPFTPLRAASFVLIWAGLAFFSWDTLRRARAT